MRLKLYRAATMAEAMAQLRNELGPEAMILSTKRVGSGIELTAALEQPEELPLVAPLAPACLALPGLALPGLALPGLALPGLALPGLASPDALDARYHAIPPALAHALAGPDLAACLQAHLRFGPLPLDGAPLLFAGTPGAGKTLSVARLATRLVLSGTRPVVITADARRAGGAEELAAYTRLLGLTLIAASTPASIGRALAEAPPGAPVLIDTAGINPFAPEETAALAALLQATGAASVLVMQAGAHPDEAAEQAAAFAGLGIAHLLPTRLDIARRLGSVLAAADPHGPALVLTEAGIGTGATDGLIALTPDFLAARLLAARPLAASPFAESLLAESLLAESLLAESLGRSGVQPPALRRPVFPSARAHAAEAWNLQPHG